jgi:DNA-directed RNA polymerase subunit RPC12/RpoP
MTTWLLITVFTAVILIAGVFIANRHLVGFILLACALLLLLIRWHAANFAYRCPVCENEFEISTFKDLISPHRPATKYLRCPNCGARDWASVLKKPQIPSPGKSGGR